MKQKLKQFTAIILSLVMMLTLLTDVPISFADESKEENQPKQEESVNLTVNETAEVVDNETSLKPDEAAFIAPYIIRNYDPAYISKVEPAAFVTPVTYVRSNSVYVRKGDSITKESVIAGMDYISFMYDVDPDSDWYVMMPNSNLGVMKPSKVTVIYNNDRAEFIKDMHYDKKTSLLYIKKSVVDDPENEYELFDEAAPVAVQAEYGLAEKYHEDGTPDYSKVLPLTVMNDGSKENYEYQNVEINNIFDTCFVVPSVVSDPSLYSAADFTILLNGTLATLSEDTFAYNEETGEIRIEESPSVISGVTIIVKNKNIIDKITNSLIDKAHAISFNDMKCYRNSNDKLVRISSEDGNLAEDMYVGWRGYYNPKVNDTSGSSDAANATVYYNSSDKVYKLKNVPNSMKYMYFGTAKSVTWALATYTKGTDVSKSGNNGNITDPSVKINFPKSLTSTTYSSKDKKTPYAWMEVYRHSLALFGTKDKLAVDKSASGKQVWRNKDHVYAGLTFAFKFPNNISGATELIPGESHKKLSIDLKADGVNEDDGKIWLAGYCAHYADDSGADGQDDNNKNFGYHGDKVCVSCLGMGETSKDEPYAIFAFAGDSTYTLNGNGSGQTGMAIYKFVIETPPPPITIVKKACTGEKPSWWDVSSINLKDAEFRLYTTKSNATSGKNHVAVFTTKADGTTETREVEAGDYWLKETKLPGTEEDKRLWKYMDPNPKQITVKDTPNKTQKFTVVDWPETPKRYYKIYKTHNGAPEAEAEFLMWPKKYGTYAQIMANSGEIYKSIPDEVKSEITTDNKGKGQTEKELPTKSAVFSGKYYLYQTKGPSTAKLIENKEVILLDGEEEIQPEEIDDTDIKLSFMKTDKITGQVVPEAGTEFKVKSQGAFEELSNVLKGYYVDKDAPPQIQKEELNYIPGQAGNIIQAESNMTYLFTITDDVDIQSSLLITAVGASGREIEFNFTRGEPCTENFSGDGYTITFSYNSVSRISITGGEENHEQYQITGIYLTTEEPAAPTQHNPLSDEDKGKAIDAFFSSNPVAAFAEMGIKFDNAAWKKIANQSTFTTEENGITPEITTRTSDFGDYEVYEMKPPANYKLPNYRLAAREYETASDDDKPVPFTISSAGQTGVISVKDMPNPSISTSAKDKTTKQHFGYIGETSSIVDSVSYYSAEVGKEYTIFGTLMDQEKNEALKDNEGHEITAHVKFTPSKSNDKKDVTFEFPSEIAKGKKLVVYEELYEGSFDKKPADEPVATHKDINDENQTVSYPSGWTEAKDDDTNSQMSSPSAATAITDTFHYENLPTDVEYKLTGEVVDQETGNVIKTIVYEDEDESSGDDSGSSGSGNTDDDDEPAHAGVEKEVRKEEAFTPEESSGSYDLTFYFDSTDLGGKNLVVFETLEYNGKVIIEHKNLNDEKQTIYFPAIETSAKDTTTNSHLGHHGEEVTVRDTVTYKNLIPGKKYNVIGKLIDYSTEEELMVYGGSADDEIDDSQPAQTITAESGTFIPEEKNGSVAVDFKLDTRRLAGCKIVVFETLVDEAGNTIALHEDIDDEEQTIIIPKIETTATDAATKSHIGALNEGSKTVIKDIVKCENLIPGLKYSVHGTLYDKSTGNPLKQNNKDVTAEGSFTPDKTTHEIELSFEVENTLLKGKSVVAFEELKHGNNLVAKHTDINDEGQTVMYSSISTTVVDTNTGDSHIASYGEKITLKDTLYYESFTAGEEYKVSGTLYDKDTNKPLTVDDKEITAEKTFTPNKSSGSVDIEFEIDTTKLGGKTIVVFENVFFNDSLVAEHKNINDKKQTIWLPEIGTSAKDLKTQNHTGEHGENTTVIDTVLCNNLLPGMQYVVKGTLYDKETNKPLVIDGKEVKAEKVFTAAKADENVELSFSVNSKELSNHTLVAFEKMYFGSALVAIHENIEDEEQSVHYPGIRTSAVDSKTKDSVLSFSENTKVIDTVDCENLVVGNEYTIKGILYDKDTNKPVTINNKQVTSEKTFTPESKNCSIPVEFTFDSTGLPKHTLVVFEELYSGNTVIARHKDIGDARQTVYAPKIGTTATDNLTQDHVGSREEVTKITDAVNYESLVPNKEYILTGTLHNKKTGDAIGEPVTKTFTPISASGEVSLEFTVDSSLLEGKSVVAFEEMHHNDILVAIHADIKDDDQTVNWPKIGTTLKDKLTNSHIGSLGEKITLVDTVKYENLMTDREYKVKGTLMDKETGKPISISGKNVTAEKTFTPSKTEGTIDITFVLDSKEIDGKTIVAYEKLYYKDKLIEFHENINDEEQTVWLSHIRTEAIDGSTENHIGELGEEVSIKDTVSYSNLIPGEEYTLKGVLYSKETGKPVLINGEEVTATGMFQPDKSDGKHEMKFTFSSKELAGKTLVVFETLFRGDTLIAKHEDIEDEDQSVYYPEIETTATDNLTQGHVGSREEVTKITDVVRYKNLVPNKEYTLTGTLHNKKTGDAIGEAVTKKFTPASASGEEKLEFTVDSSLLEGESAVAFEELKHNDILVAIHADIDDNDQTVNWPKIGTTLKDKLTNSHIGSLGEEIALVDTVKYENLMTGREYNVKGALMDKETGKPISVNGKNITAEETFTPSEAEGTIDVIFKLDSKEIDGETVVAFEKLYYKDKLIESHEDINDDGQTVWFPHIGTEAKDGSTENHIGELGKEVSIKDTVEYSNLIPGKEYTLKGVLYSKETGKPVLVDGEEVTATDTFQPDKSDGKHEMKFRFSSEKLAGKTLVVFERLLSGDTLIARHEDIEDEDQSVHYPKIETTATDNLTLDHVGSREEVTKVKDVVKYSNLIPDKEYVLTGTLHNKKTGDAIGEAVTKKFTPASESGEEKLEFTVDSSLLEGESAVAFEELKHNDILVAVHTDIDDDDQTVNWPKIGTTLKDKQTDSHIGSFGEKIALVDTVKYENLMTGREYTVKGVLMDKKTGKPFTVNDNNITAEETFTPSEAEGTIDVTFKLDSKEIDGKTVVAFEKLYYKDKLIESHENINDEEQTVWFPHIGTEARDGSTENHIGERGEEVTIKDTVKYSNLVPGVEYKVEGKLYDKETGKPVLIDGEEVTVIDMFQPDKSDGKHEMKFRFSSEKLTGKTLVVFERLLSGDTLIARHEDIEDEDQSVYYPEIETTATDNLTLDHVGSREETTKVTDVVKYKNLVPNKEYTLTGTLHNKKTGDAIGEAVTKKFTPASASGEEKLEFIVDSSLLEGESAVAFEELHHDDVFVAIHADIKDEDQTVNWPKIRTTLKDELTDSHVGSYGDRIKLIDTVRYENLMIGREYTVEGVLMNQKTDKPFTVGGEKITAKETFTPTDTKGTIDIVFELDSRDIDGKAVVAFEKLYYKNAQIESHEDINDDGQTVWFPHIGTEARDGSTENHIGELGKEVSIKDTVSYSNLVPGEDYTLSGVLYSKETGRPVLVDGEEVTATDTFQPAKSEGEYEVEFKFSSKELAGRTLVVFEKLFRGDVLVARHEDIDDEDQSVHYPEISTTASDDLTMDHVGSREDVTKVIDIVTYKNLIPGKEYTITGTLHNKKTEEPIGESVTKKFTPESASGEKKIEFTVDSSLLEGESAVAFEELKHNDILVAVHTDIEDDDQTVNWPKIGTTLKDKLTDSHIGSLGEKITLNDTVKYENLMTGREYTVKGVLMDKGTGEPLTVDGRNITAEQSFTPSETEGSVDITFELDTNTIDGKTVVAFEKLYLKDRQIEFHEDIDDEEQTIWFPHIETEAKDGSTNTHTGELGEAVTIKDNVKYSNLVPGVEYKVEGKLYDKDTKEPLVIDGKEVTATDTFTPQESDGEYVITFSFNSEELAGHKLVAFEKLFHGETLIARHEEIEDEEQTIYEPYIETEAKDGFTGNHSGKVDKGVTVKDTIKYTNLVPGVKYSVQGKLYDKETGEPVLVDGEEVTAADSFIPDKPDGEYTIEFLLTSEELAGKTVVAFEKLYCADALVARHEDIEDEEQSVHYPEVETTAVDSRTKDNVLSFNKKAIVFDTVEYSNLIPGNEYTLKGSLMDKETEKEIKADGGTATFIPDEADGEAIVKFEFDSTKLDGHTLVAFERLYSGETEIASHKDIDDDDQTVFEPEIRTVAKFKNGKKKLEVKDNENVVVVDTVKYRNLVPGEKYTVSGVLMNKGTKRATPARAERTFTASRRNGEIQLSFKLRPAAYGKSAVFVAFETMKHEGSVVAVHKDINDADQTVSTAMEKPGDSMSYPLLALISLVLLGFSVIVIAIRRRKGIK